MSRGCQIRFSQGNKRLPPLGPPRESCDSKHSDRQRAGHFPNDRHPPIPLRRMHLMVLPRKHQKWGLCSPGSRLSLLCPAAPWSGIPGLWEDSPLASQSHELLILTLVLAFAQPLQGTCPAQLSNCDARFKLKNLHFLKWVCKCAWNRKVLQGTNPWGDAFKITTSTDVMIS